MISNGDFLFINSVSEDELEHEDKHSEWFVEVETESKEDKVRDMLEDLSTSAFSMGAVEYEADDEMREVKESKEDKFLMKDFDPFFPLKRSSNFLFSNLFLRSLSFFDLDSSEVKISFFFSDKGPRHDSAGSIVSVWRKEGVDAHFTLEIDAFLGVERLGETKHDAIDSLFKGGWIEVLVGAWCDLLLGLNEECDAALEARLRATKADAAE